MPHLYLPHIVKGIAAVCCTKDDEQVSTMVSLNSNVFEVLLPGGINKLNESAVLQPVCTQL